MDDFQTMLIAGNLGQPLHVDETRGTIHGLLIAAHTSVAPDGRLQNEKLVMPIQVACGIITARELQRRYPMGSRVVLQGRMLLQRTRRMEQLPAADGSGSVLVDVTRVQPILHVAHWIDAGGISGNPLESQPIGAIAPRATLPA